MKNFCKTFVVGTGDQVRRQLMIMSTISADKDYQMLSVNSLHDNGDYMQLNIPITELPIEPREFAQYVLDCTHQTQADLFFKTMIALHFGVKEEIEKHGEKVGNFLSTCLQEFRQQKKGKNTTCDKKQLH